MASDAAATEGEPNAPRARCYACYRPLDHCFCDIIPRIENRTSILILQHARERFHAFNTARIVRRALVNSHVAVGFTPDFMQPPADLSPHAGLLYPGPNARLIDDVEPDQRPDQIVVLDGTWHHAKTMMRDLPWLQNLPQYRIDPATPSQYRIRREPSIDALSTVEATVDLLRSIEPDTPGFDELLTAFNTMIDRHIQVIGTAQPRHQSRETNGNRVATNVPRNLLVEPARIVVAYGESVPIDASRRGSNVPVVWSAQRLGTEESFYCRIKPPCPLSDTILNHMELDRSAFDGAPTLDEFRSQWRAFIRPGDTVFVYSKGTRQLLQTFGLHDRCELLRSMDFVGIAQPGTLKELLDSLNVHPAPTTLPGRAGKRLANAIALAMFVRQSAGEH